MDSLVSATKAHSEESGTIAGDACGAADSSSGCDRKMPDAEAEPSQPSAKEGKSAATAQAGKEPRRGIVAGDRSAMLATLEGLHSNEAGQLSLGLSNGNCDDSGGTEQGRATAYVAMADDANADRPSDGVTISQAGSQEENTSFTPGLRAVRTGGNIFLTCMRIRSEERGGWAGLMDAMSSAVTSSLLRRSEEPVSRFQRASSRVSSAVLGPMEGILKMQRGMCFCKHNVSRHFVLRALQPSEPRLLWWREGAAMESDATNGGSLCRGIIDLVTDDVEIDTVRGSRSAFELYPRRGNWDKSASRDLTLRRSIVLDAAGSNFARDEWIEALRDYIRRGIAARAAAVAESSQSSA